MTEEFYLKHKDKSWELPKFPDDDIDETSASQVVNWVFNEMKAGNMGWLEVNLLNPSSFESFSISNASSKICFKDSLFFIIF